MPEPLAPFSVVVDADHPLGNMTRVPRGSQLAAKYYPAGDEPGEFLVVMHPSVAAETLGNAERMMRFLDWAKEEES